MSSKADYTPEQWHLLKEAPAIVGLAVITADPSGPVGIFQELYSVGKTVVQTQQQGAASPLVQAVVDELVAERGQDMQPDRDQVQGKDLEQLKLAALDSCRQIAAALAQHATPEEALGFKQWLLDVGRKVSEAASEGGFLGFGGTRVSAAETQALAEIAAALGVSA